MQQMDGEDDWDIYVHSCINLKSISLPINI